MFQFAQLSPVRAEHSALKGRKDYAHADFACFFFSLSHVPRQKVNTSRLMSCFCIAVTTTTYCGSFKSYAYQLAFSTVMPTAQLLCGFC